jgi:hypothetical protein
VLPRILTKPGILCSATHLSDLRSEELCTSTNQKQLLNKNLQGTGSRRGIPLGKDYSELMGRVLYKQTCSTKSKGLCAVSLILNRHGIPPTPLKMSNSTTIYVANLKTIVYRPNVCWTQAVTSLHELKIKIKFHIKPISVLTFKIFEILNYLSLRKRSENSPENKREIQTFWCSQKRQAASTSLPHGILIKHSIQKSYSRVQRGALCTQVQVKVKVKMSTTCHTSKWASGDITPIILCFGAM